MRRGVFVRGGRFGGWGRIGPFGDAEVREGEVGFFLGHQVGVGSEGELRILVAELIRDPSEALAGGEGGGRVGVAGAVELEGADCALAQRRKCCGTTSLSTGCSRVPTSQLDEKRRGNATQMCSTRKLGIYRPTSVRNRFEFALCRFGEEEEHEPTQADSNRQGGRDHSEVARLRTCEVQREQTRRPAKCLQDRP